MDLVAIEMNHFGNFKSDHLEKLGEKPSPRGTSVVRGKFVEILDFDLTLASILPV